MLHVKKYKDLIEFTYGDKLNFTKRVFYMPFSVTDKLNLYDKGDTELIPGSLGKISFYPYRIGNNVYIYVSTHNSGYSFDKFPCIADITIAKEWKMQDIKTVELRGKSFQEGFKKR